ncbi:glycosyltransferase family 2 protein [Glycocaulis profundi]|nr:glycosyltransferase family 2 protein [Glycocaulis profundi]
MTDGRPSVSAVMVSYRTGPVLFDAVTACLNAPDIAELIVVSHDNPPEDAARLDALSASEATLTVIHTGANLGFSKGCNIGARVARGSHLLFLNPDTVIPHGAAARLAETGADLPEPWITGARILNLDGSEQRGARRGELTLLSAMAGFSGLSRVLPVRDIHREHEPVPEGPEPVPAVSGAGMMMSRAGFDALGGFDERYFLHVEDLDICRRARDAGGQVVFEPRAELFHHGSTSKVSLFRVEWAKARGLMRYFLTHARGAGRVAAGILSPLIVLAVMARAGVLTVLGKLGVFERRSRKASREAARASGAE